MILNFLKSGIRAMQRNKLYAFVNIGGLAIGLASVLLILLYVRGETGYDSWLPDSERIYRIHTTYALPDRPTFNTVRSPGGLGWDIKNQIGEIESYARIAQFEMTVLDDERAFAENISVVDTEIFDVFDLPFIEGSAETAFDLPTGVVLNESTAQKYFGDQNPIGETITLCCMGDAPLPLTVTGVIRDIPQNSHLEIDMMIQLIRDWFRPFPNLFETYSSVNTYSYMKLYEGADPELVDEKIQRWLDTLIPVSDNLAAMGIEKSSDYRDMKLMPIEDIYLNAREQAADLGDMRPLGSQDTINAFLLISGLVMLIAMINFINLATASAIKRAREISVRKVLGASRKVLVMQFLAESIFSVFIAAIVALMLAELALPLFNQIMDRQIDISVTDPLVLAQFLGGTIIVGVLSGSYPALVLSGYKPARILRSNQSSSFEGGTRLRQMLVIAQFAIAIALVMGTGIIYLQTNYASTTDLGFDRANKIILRNNAGGNSQQALINELERHPNIDFAVPSSEVPTDNRENNGSFTVQGQDNKNSVLTYFAVGMDYFKAYDITPAYGRTFDENYGSDRLTAGENEDDPYKGGAVINSFAARQLGFQNPEDAIGATVTGNFFSRPVNVTIIGIIPEIRLRSLRYGVRPLLFIADNESTSSLTINVQNKPMNEIIPEIERIWQQHMPQTAFRYEILNELIEAQYSAEESQARLLSWFSALAILISALGLFALAAHSIATRTKEIGIRKVLGAGFRDIMQMMVWQFSKPVLWAALLATPIAGWFILSWLEGFSARLPGTTVWAFAGIATLLALLVAAITVTYHSWAVAHTNPIKALRYE